MTCQSRTHPDMSRRMSGSDGNSVRGWSCSHWEQTSSISSMTRAVIQIGDNWLSAVFPSARGGTSDDLALYLPKLSFTCAAVCSRLSGDGCGYAGGLAGNLGQSRISPEKIGIASCWERGCE